MTLIPANFLCKTFQGKIYGGGGGGERGLFLEGTDCNVFMLVKIMSFFNIHKHMSGNIGAQQCKRSDQSLHFGVGLHFSGPEMNPAPNWNRTAELLFISFMS